MGRPRSFRAKKKIEILIIKNSIRNIYSHGLNNLLVSSLEKRRRMPLKHKMDKEEIYERRVAG